MEDVFKKVPNWLRYIIAIPVGIISVLVGYFVVRLSVLWISEPGSPYYNLSFFIFKNFINILLFFYTFNLALPKHQFKITLTLAIILGIFYNILIGFSLNTIQLSVETIVADILVILALVFSCIIAFKEFPEKSCNIQSKEDLEKILKNNIELNSIISKSKKIKAPYLIGKQNPYTAEYINSYDDMIKYLQMYQFDNQGVDPVENYNKLMER